MNLTNLQHGQHIDLDKNARVYRLHDTFLLFRGTTYCHAYWAKSNCAEWDIENEIKRWI